MDDDFDLPFDFGLGVGRSSGARIEISPGDRGPDEDKFINIDERPFWLIEFFICKKFSAFSHYGTNKIDLQIWSSVISDSKEYLESIDDRASIGTEWADRGYYELAKELRESPDTTLLGFRDLLQDLSDITIIWARAYENVFILGV